MYVSSFVSRTMIVNKENVHKYIHKSAHEVAKKKCKNQRLPEDDEEVKKIEAEMERCICFGGPNVKTVVGCFVGGVLPGL